MKRSVLACLAIVSAIPAAAAPGDPNNDIVAVAPNTSIQQWVSTVSERLDGTLRYPYTFREPAPSGTVSVTFKCSESGEPAAIQVVRQSGNSSLDRAAVSAVQRIKSLHPLPMGIGREQLFQANIVFATDERALAKEEAALRTASRHSNEALAMNGQAPLVIGVRFLK